MQTGKALSELNWTRVAYQSQSRVLGGLRRRCKQALFHWYVDLDSFTSSLGNERWALGPTIAPGKSQRPQLCPPNLKGPLSQRGIPRSCQMGKSIVDCFKGKCKGHARKDYLSFNTPKAHISAFIGDQTVSYLGPLESN